MSSIRVACSVLPSSPPVQDTPAWQGKKRKLIVEIQFPLSFSLDMANKNAFTVRGKGDKDVLILSVLLWSLVGWMKPEALGKFGVNENRAAERAYFFCAWSEKGGQRGKNGSGCPQIAAKNCSLMAGLGRLSPNLWLAWRCHVLDHVIIPSQVNRMR